MISLFIGFGLIIGIWFKLMVFVIMGWFDFGVKMVFYNYFYIRQIIKNFVWHILNSWIIYKKISYVKTKTLLDTTFFGSSFITYHFNKLWRFCRINCVTRLVQWFGLFPPHLQTCVLLMGQFLTQDFFLLIS